MVYIAIQVSTNTLLCNDIIGYCSSSTSLTFNHYRRSLNLFVHYDTSAYFDALNRTMHTLQLDSFNSFTLYQSFGNVISHYNYSLLISDQTNDLISNHNNSITFVNTFSNVMISSNSCPLSMNVFNSLLQMITFGRITKSLIIIYSPYPLIVPNDSTIIDDVITKALAFDIRVRHDSYCSELILFYSL